MPSVPKPFAVTVSAIAISSAAFTAAGAPAWATAASSTAPALAGIALSVTGEIRANRRDRHQQARQDAADEQLRSLERQAARAVRTIADPDRRAAALLQLINAHTAAKSHVDEQ